MLAARGFAFRSTYKAHPFHAPPDIQGRSPYNVKNAFGNALRAARLGWHFSARHDCMVRMSTLGVSRYFVEVCPSGSVPSKHTPAGEHVVWWEGESDLLALCLPLQKVKSPESYQSFKVGDDGDLLR